MPRQAVSVLVTAELPDDFVFLALLETRARDLFIEHQGESPAVVDPALALATLINLGDGPAELFEIAKSAGIQFGGYWADTVEEAHVEP